MNYEKIYKDFIDNRKNKPVDGFSETHHIIPKALGGSDDEDNLIELSCRDHYFAHRLLAKFAGHKMKIALSWFVNGNNLQTRHTQPIPSRTVGIIREESNIARSVILKGRVFSNETRQKMSDNQWLKNGRGESWCKGLTKETDVRIKRLAEKVSQTKQENPTEAWNKGMSGDDYKARYKNGGLTPPSMTGRIWINNGKEQRKIMNYEPIPEGWTRGRCDIKGDNNPMRKKQNEN